MKKGNGKIGNFMSWADSRYGGGREEKPPPPNPSLPQPAMISYDLRNNRIFPYPNRETDEVSQAKLRIAKAREENLALKRIIAAKSIQQNPRYSAGPALSRTPNHLPPSPSPSPSPLPQSRTMQSSSQPEFKPSPSPRHENPHPPPHEEHQDRVKSHSRPPSHHSLPPQQPPSDSLLPPSLPEDDQNSQPLKPPLPSSSSSTTTAPSPSSPPSKPKKKKKKPKSSEQILKKKLQKEKELEQRTLLEHSMSDLKRFSTHLDAAIDDNKKLLQGDLPSLDLKLDQNKMTQSQREAKKKLKKEEKQKREKLKLQMDSLIRGQILTILPRWRHRLRGNWNPKPEEILKGKSLFRVGYLMVMHFYVKPRRAIQYRKAQSKSSEMDSFLKSLLLLIDNTGHWLGKLIKLPISSIIQDSLLNFQPIKKADRLPRSGTHPMRQRILQIKVRVTSVIHSLTSVSTLPPHIQDFLVSLISDGNYFKDGFLFDFEQRNLEFNSLGATRHMILKPHEETLLAILSKNKGTNQLCLHTFENVVYDISRPKLLIKNFLLLRVLVYNVILSPWNYGAAPSPKMNLRQIILNLRIFASIIYEMCRYNDPLIPPVELPSHEQKSRKYGKTLSHQDTRDLAAVAEHDQVNSWILWLSFVLDSLMGSTASQNNEEKNLFETTLLGTRKPYDNLAVLISSLASFLTSCQGIHSFLFEESYFADIRNEIEPWMKDLSQLLDDWILQITKSCVEIKILEEKKRLALHEQMLSEAVE